MKYNKIDFGKIYQKMDRFPDRQTEVVYVFLNKDQRLFDQEKQSLQKWTATRLIFLRDEAILDALARKSELHATYDMVLSLSGGGEETYNQLVGRIPGLAHLPHKNIEISRDNFGQTFKQLSVENSKVLIIDDDCLTGLTLDRMAGRIGASNTIVSAVQWVPKNIVQQLMLFHQNMTVVAGYELEIDPAKVKMDMFSFSDWISIAEGHKGRLVGYYDVFRSLGDYSDRIIRQISQRLREAERSRFNNGS